MKISYENLPNGQFVVGPVPEYELEVAPFPAEFRLDFSAENPDPEAIVAAATILFPHALPDSIISSPKVSAAVGKSLVDFVACENIHFKVNSFARKTKKHQTRLLIGRYRESVFPIQVGKDTRNILFQIRDSATWRGKFFSTDRVELAANLGTFQSVGLSLSEIYAAIALCISNDWSSRVVRVERTEDLRSDQAESIEKLLNSLGYNFAFIDRDEFEMELSKR